MKENQLLATLARLCGDIAVAQNDATGIAQLQQALAAALINDPSAQADESFQFQQLENYATQGLDPSGIQHLSDVIQRVQQTPQAIDPTVRVFRREVPFISSQVRGSVPPWGRGGQIIDTIGPILNNEGRRLWFDFYRAIPVVQIWLQGAARPFALLPIELGRLAPIRGPRSYRIPPGSVWIQADIFAAASPDQLYCGLAVQEGEISFSGPLTISADNKFVVPPGMQVTIQLNLAQKEVTDTSPDDHGIDVREASIVLPKTLSVTVHHSGRTIRADNAEWNLYGQQVRFQFDSNQQAAWNAELNRISLPYRASETSLVVRQSKSPVCSVNGEATIAAAAWTLPAAAINIAAPVAADGTGAMAVVVLEGLQVSWTGLKDVNLKEKTSALLKNAVVMLMPGRINIATLAASHPQGKQRFYLWQEPTVNGVEKPVQYIDLNFTRQFHFFYDSLQKGTETVSVQTNCVGHINKPVQVNGAPFKLESLQTVFTLSMSAAQQIVMLYDDNIIRDNWSKSYKPIPGVPVPPVTFKSTAIALNNALLTVSPLYAMLLYGDLKDEDSFDKAALLFSFGLLQYLPTLPDPYAANVSLLRRRRPQRTTEGKDENRYLLTDVAAMLVCTMRWEDRNEPSVQFLLGDKPANAESLQPTSNAIAVTDNEFKLDVFKNRDAIEHANQLNVQRATALHIRNWKGVTDNEQESAAMLETQQRMMMVANQAVARSRVSPFTNAFVLLDVSTNADLMGVSLAFSNDEFVFGRTHVPQAETGNPISIQGLDVQATSRLVQIFALPQVSWEPMINLTTDVTNTATDPYPGVLYFLNDGVPAQIANTGNTPVPIAPIPLTQEVTKWYNENNLPLWSYFTLSNGMLALALYFNDAENKKPVVELVEAAFDGKLVDKTFTDFLFAGLQIKTVGIKDDINQNRKFFGSAHQLSNVNNLFFPGTNNRSVLSGSVTEIFNGEFGSLGGLKPDMYVPLERYDFSGYGANVFSHWVNQNAALAQTSQAMFDVWRGRTAHEVVQVKSVIYPWGIRVVRTITIYRGSNGFPWRTDSGWKAESDGIYDFRTPIKAGLVDPSVLQQEKDREYKFHPGMVEGVYNVRNIKEDTVLAPFVISSWFKNYGVYIDNQGHPQPVGAGQNLSVKLVPVYFDADVKMDDVTQGATDGFVPGRRMLGYIQLSPRGVFIEPEQFAQLLTKMDGLGGPVDCTVNINQSKQLMRISRVEVNPSLDAGGKRVFVAAAKGTPILPKDGSWSVVEHNASTKEVLPLSGNNAIPLIREGVREFVTDTLKYTQDKVSRAVNVAEATELFKNLEDRAKQYGFLQSTGENKVLFRNPLFENGVEVLKGSIPDLADAYHLMNSKGIFPKLEDLPKITEMAADFYLDIKEQGYKLLNKVQPDKLLEQAIPEGPWYIVKTNDVKVYIQYKSKGDGGADKPAKLNFNIDSMASKWVNKMNDISMFVDLGSYEKILIIRGKFDTKKGEAPRFVEPILEFGPQLQPVYDILVLLSQLSVKPDYKDILKKGLKIAMSNSPNNWEYKFQADKEIPVLRFPPPSMDTAAAPLRLEAALKAGVYFNVAIPLPPTNGIQAPSAGAFVEFFAKLSVMCASVGVGSIYAVGQATVRISADTVVGPALYMKFGFGVEAVVALPVIGSVSVYFAAGVEMSLDSSGITIAGFILFRGRAEIFGGIVTVTILIEASGKVKERKDEETQMVAQVTFSLDISVCFVIDISFTEQWQEQRQIA